MSFSDIETLYEYAGHLIGLIENRFVNEVQISIFWTASCGPDEIDRDLLRDEAFTC